SATGALVAQAAARRLAPSTLELGGKAAAIVFADADLDEVAQHALIGAFANAGQNCCARSRVLVETSVAGALAKRMAAESSAWRPGPPRSGARMGPVISAARRAEVEHLVGVALDEGATLVAGGAVPGGASSKGYYWEPSILSDVEPSSTIAQNEI